MDGEGRTSESNRVMRSAGLNSEAERGAGSIEDCCEPMIEEEMGRGAESEERFEEGVRAGLSSVAAEKLRGEEGCEAGCWRLWCASSWVCAWLKPWGM